MKSKPLTATSWNWVLMRSRLHFLTNFHFQFKWYSSSFKWPLSSYSGGCCHLGLHSSLKKIILINLMYHFECTSSYSCLWLDQSGYDLLLSAEPVSLLRKFAFSWTGTDFITSRPCNDLMGGLEMVACMQLQIKEIEETCEHRLNR